MTPERHYKEAQECLDLIKQNAGDRDFGYEQANTLTFSSIAHSLQGLLKLWLEANG